MLLRARVTDPLRAFPPTRVSSSSAVAIASGNKTSIRAADTEPLRSQLDLLHTEADATRSKANNARSRLLRLSETAEMLKERAAIKIQDGKEAEARELLVQKKKLMQALENSKTRIQILDELSAKLNEVITLKEAQLIENVAIHPAFSTQKSSKPVHFVYPKGDTDASSSKTSFYEPSIIGSTEKEEMLSEKFKNDPHVDYHLVDEVFPGIASSSTIVNEKYSDSILSHRDFIKSVDEQLQRVEEDMNTLLRSLIMENEREKISIDVQQILECLKDLQRIRERIHVILQKKSSND